MADAADILEFWFEGDPGIKRETWFRGGPEFDERRSELLAAADGDASGGLSASEMVTLRELIHEARREARFARLDVDGSGEVSLEELENGRRHRRPGRPFRR